MIDCKEFFTNLEDISPRFIKVGKKDCGFTVSKAGLAKLTFVNAKGQKTKVSIYSYYAPDAPACFLSTIQPTIMDTT